MKEIRRDTSRLRVAFRVYSRVLNSVQDWTRSHWRSHWRIRTLKMRGGGGGGESDDGREMYDIHHEYKKIVATVITTYSTGS